LEDTNDLLRHDPELSAHLDDLIWAFRDTGDLVPQTVDKLGSGHYFPFAEAETELNTAVLLAERGFYRHAMVALRSVLELGLLSAYWDRTDHAEVEIQNWLHSVAPTPRAAEILKGLRTIPAVRAFEQAVDLGGLLREIYNELSDFVHTRGYRFSGQHLNRANVVQFNEAAFRHWTKCLRSVVRLVVIVHLLKYPVGLQHTPLMTKFGLNEPAGGFLNPSQAKRLCKTLEPEHVRVLQRISDADESAVALARQIQEMPDISDEEFDQQVLDFDKSMIQMQGFRAWSEGELRVHGSLRESDRRGYAEIQQRINALREWAEANGLMERRQIPDD
jgi:hypothetical protein